MADTILTVIIPGAANERVKYLIEKRYFGGQVKTAAVIKTAVENWLKNQLKSELMTLDALDKQEALQPWEPQI